MALSVNYTVNGVVIPNAYVCIMAERCDKRTNRNLIGYGVFATQAKAHDLKEQPLFQTFFEMPFSLDATGNDAYTEMKTLPEFAGAVDV